MDNKEKRVNEILDELLDIVFEDCLYINKGNIKKALLKKLFDIRSRVELLTNALDKSFSLNTKEEEELRDFLKEAREKNKRV